MQWAEYVLLTGVQKQSGSADCGVFAIAFATSIALGKDPSKNIYTQSLMRKHLADCLIHTSFKLFP